jgi:superfamily II DNA or RNA helicase
MAEPRSFSRKQKRALYLAADGRCKKCAADLQEGWHADHIVPYDKGGGTTIDNGQALCPECNQRKSNDMPGSIAPRPFQAESMEKAKINAREGKNSLVAVAAPGSGKTFMSLMVLNELWKKRHINTALIFVPRFNLCEQFESESGVFVREMGGPTMGKIFHVKNEPPLLGRAEDQFGIVTTYQSLISDPTLYERIVRRHRAAVVFDEAHQLGREDNPNRDIVSETESHRYCERLARDASFSLVMTGTEKRPDGRLVLPEVVEYTEPNEQDVVYMKPDVVLRYRDGVEQGHLRRFEYELHDGQAERDYLDRVETLTLSEMEDSLSDIMREEGYWKPMVDKTIQRTREAQSIHPDLCALIGATRQDHARKVARYMESQSSFDVRIAVSDNQDASDQLKAFRSGDGDILVTVGMAHVGFDHKPITVVCCLNPFRTFPWLFQFFARGLRMWDEIDEAKQYLRAIVPDDPQMREFVEEMRRQSEAGIQLRDRDNRGGDGGPEGEPELYSVQNGRVTDVHAKGFNPESDVDPDFYDQIREPAKELAPGVPLGNLKQIIERVGDGSTATATAPEPQTSAPNMTHRERLKAFRKRLAKEFKSVDAHLKRRFGDDMGFGYTAQECKRDHDWTGLPECKTIDELKKRERWLSNFKKEVGYE